jgi:hypothetical protein
MLMLIAMKRKNSGNIKPVPERIAVDLRSIREIKMVSTRA